MCSVSDGVDKTECDNWSDGIAEWVQNEPMTELGTKVGTTE